MWNLEVGSFLWGLTSLHFTGIKDFYHTDTERQTDRHIHTEKVAVPINFIYKLDNFVGGKLIIRQVSSFNKPEHREESK